ncbi:hypothetical protein C481_20376 [Natrialba asiatica DSM 12278]|uniref:Uncharacterized protein n=1 Tax=Natrialba asiatica (strain ATCC 700177 / DSM 12278 / JCM 9576 / FERM P-10747 / NBRC 102637 / 172P1) TaxID=29540 RepID=M0AJ56_NATA1|nr:hypothetical protein C481_20376 [Natrialba asiatica DSM 12278]
MQTASQITNPLAVEFTTESDSTVEHSRFDVFDASEHTNTSCDYCGKFGLVPTQSCETARDLGVQLICSDCESA